MSIFEIIGRLAVHAFLVIVLAYAWVIVLAYAWVILLGIRSDRRHEGLGGLVLPVYGGIAILILGAITLFVHVGILL